MGLQTTSQKLYYDNILDYDIYAESAEYSVYLLIFN